MTSFSHKLSVVLLLCWACISARAESVTISQADFLPRYLHGEYRYLFEVSKAGTYETQLESIADDAALIVSVYGEASTTVRVYAGDSVIASRRAPVSESWLDWRFTIPRLAHGGHALRIVYECAGPALIGLPTASLVNRDATPVLVYLVDTLRTDRLGSYGGTRGLTPNMDGLAEDGIRATRMVPASSWTRPSVASLLSGMHPPAHGAEDAPDHIRPDIPSVAGELRNGGYRAIGFMSNPNGLPEWGFGAGFDRYMNAYAHEWEIPTDRKVVDLAIQSSRRMADMPWFIYAHVMGPHNPYSPEKWFSLRYRKLWYPGNDQEKRIAREIDAYDAEVAYADYHFGRLISELKRQRIYDRALIILTSDHGEELWEHGINGHGESVRETLLRIPLIIKLPGGKGGGRVVDDYITHADLGPTILDVLEMAAPSTMQGVSRLATILDDRTTSAPEFSILTRNTFTLATTQIAGIKYVRDLDNGEVQWFDLAADPEERNPLDVAPDGADELIALTEMRAVMDRPGLFVMLPTNAVDIEIELDAQYEVNAFGLSTDGLTWDGSTLRVSVEAGAGVVRGLHIAATMDARFSVSSSGALSVLRDQTSVPYESGAALSVGELASAPGAIRWEGIGHDRVHIWAISAPPARAEGEEMSDEMREALEGLGYL